MTPLLIDGALCSINDLRERLGIETTEQNDQMFAQFISAFSSTFESTTGRRLAIRERTAYFSIYRTAVVQLPAFPIVEDAPLEVWNDPMQEFTASTMLTENSDYVVHRETGTIEKLNANLFLIGFDSFPRDNYKQSFLSGQRALKVRWTGGLVVPRPAWTPTVGVSAGTTPTTMDGLFKWRLSRIVDGIESIASMPISLALNDTSANLSFSAAGATATLRIYRTKANGDRFFHLTDLPGNATAFEDAVEDNDLGTEHEPKESGPHEAPADLKEAAIMQILDWFDKRHRPGQLQVSQVGQGAIYYYRSGRPLLPYVEEIIAKYRL